MRLTVLIVLAFTLASCGPTQWVRANTDQETFMRDSTECEAFGQTAYPRNPYWAKDMRDRCLRNKGYSPK